MNTVKVFCAKCGAAKNIPGKTCNWQCPSCSILNPYVKKEMIIKKKKHKPVVVTPSYPDVNTATSIATSMMEV